MSDSYQKFEEWFNVKYPYPTSLMVTPQQKEHLRDAFFAGAEVVATSELEFLNRLIDGLTKGEK